MESSTDADVVPLVVAISAGNRWCQRVLGLTCDAGGNLRPDFADLQTSSVEDVIDFINAHSSPLGLYLFSENQSLSKQTLNSTASGDTPLDECILQSTIHDLLFGAGNSGVGKYHGESDSAHT